MLNPHEAVKTVNSLAQSFCTKASQMPRFANNDNGECFTLQEIQRIRDFAELYKGQEVIDSIEAPYWSRGMMVAFDGERLVFGVYKKDKSPTPYEVSIHNHMEPIYRVSLEKALQELKKGMKRAFPSDQPELNVV